jgi:multidrug transporter EmrE-like cation transporter
VPALCQLEILATERVGRANSIATLKIFALSVLVVLSNVSGNCLLNIGVKEGKLVSWASVLRLVASPTLLAGILLLILWMLLRVALLSTSPMTLVLPLTAGAGYVLTGGIGQFWFREKVPLTYDYGLACIIAGVVLVGSSGCTPDPKAREPEAEPRTCAPAAGYQT